MARHAVRGACLSAALLLPPVIAKAEDFTAGVVMKKMPVSDHFPFIAGIIEGLAYARFEKDGQKPQGMVCVRKWFYDNNKEKMDQIYLAFGKFPDYPPATVISAMLKQVCK